MRARKWFQRNQARSMGTLLPRIPTLSVTGPQQDARLSNGQTNQFEGIRVGVTKLTGKEVVGR